MPQCRFIVWHISAAPYFPMPSRLEPADQTIEAVLFPVRIGLAPVSIEPQAADLTIVRAQYVQRLVQVTQIGIDVALETWLIPVEVV